MSEPRTAAGRTFWQKWRGYRVAVQGAGVGWTEADEAAYKAVLPAILAIEQEAVALDPERLATILHEDAETLSGGCYHDDEHLACVWKAHDIIRRLSLEDSAAPVVLGTPWYDSMHHKGADKGAADVGPEESVRE